jgi:hypothetical protein
METLKSQYENSEQIRKGIDTVLKSPNYTEEFKDRVRKHLNANGTDIFDSNGTLKVMESDDPNKIIISTRDGSSEGWVEKAVYIDGELIKALDTIVDELIPTGPKQRIQTVPRSVYDEALSQIQDLLEQLRQCNIDLDNAISQLQQLRAEIEALLQQLDAERLQRAAANNEAQSAEERFRGLLSNFQEAIQKGIQEAVERVSLEAQVRGLQAQKEVLLAQQADLIDIIRTLQLNLEALGGQIEFQQQQLVQQAAQQSAQLVLQSPYSGRGASGLTGWEVTNVQKPADFEKGQILRYEDNDGNRAWINGPDMILYNIDTEPMTFTVRFQTDNALGEYHANPWIDTSTGETQFTVPARDPLVTEPSRLAIRFRFTGRFNGSGKNNDYKDRVSIVTSNNDEFILQANYFYDR